MHQVKGHALLLAVGALGVIVSAEVLSALRPARIATGMTQAQNLPAPALKPLPASTAQSQYTRVLLSPADREAMARAIQRELQRVGCYRGDIDGTWGAQSRQAMGAFTVTLKLAIPFDAPDEMLLRLVQGQTQRVCGGPDLDPEQAASTPGAPPSPRLMQPPTEVKRLPKRAPGSEQRPDKAQPGTQIAETTPPPPASRRIERAPALPPSPNAPPKIVRNLMQTVSGVLAPLGF